VTVTMCAVNLAMCAVAVDGQERRAA